jgi:hypothetical protein
MAVNQNFPSTERVHSHDWQALDQNQPKGTMRIGIHGEKKKWQPGKPR